MARPVHFEIPVDDPDRAEAFYSKVFDWKVQRFEGAPEYYGMATTGAAGDGINGALFQRRGDVGTTITMSVPSIEDALKTVEANGGKVLQGKTPIPGMGYFATCADTEGNQVGVFTEDSSATM
jgi:predicted enzyme related to lactoylglutathione lyase